MTFVFPNITGTLPVSQKLPHRGPCCSYLIWGYPTTSPSSLFVGYPGYGGSPVWSGSQLLCESPGMFIIAILVLFICINSQ